MMFTTWPTRAAPRPRRSIAVALALLVGTATACTTGDDTADAPPAPAVLRIGLPEQSALDPAAAVIGAQGGLVLLDLLYDGLTSPARPGETAPRPAVASDWTSSEDQQTFTFGVGSDASFSDGTPITASDVKFSLERIAKLGPSNLASVGLDPVEGYDAFAGGSATELAGIVVHDERTVEIRLTRPYPLLPAVLGSPVYGIVPRAAVESEDVPFGTRPVGSGPYFYNGSDGPVVHLARRASNDAGPDLIEVHRVGDVEASYDSFLAGAVDWSLVPASRAEEAVADHGPAVVQPLAAAVYYGFNLGDPTFADIRFRTAIVRAIDRDAIVRTVYDGVGQSLAGLVPAGVPGAQDDPCGEVCRYDPAAARQLLAEAFPDGAIPTVALDYYVDTREEALAVALERALDAVGIPTQRRPLPANDYYSFAVSGEQRLFRLGVLGVAPTAGEFIVDQFGSGRAANATGFADPEVDRLLDEAIVQPSFEQRTKRYQEAERAVLAQVPVVPLAQLVTRSVTAPHVRGLQVNLLGTFDPTTVEVADPAP